MASMAKPIVLPGQGKTVAVTGASGYIAGHVIQQLLDKGYTVRGTVRSLKDKAKVQHLLEDLGKVRLYEADLLAQGSFDKCFEGVDYIMHTASPFQLAVKDPQKDLVDPAVKGTLNVLTSAHKAGTVKRVVVTSSCAAVVMQNPPSKDKVWTEEDWNTDSTLENGPYRLSKSKAERAAWDFFANEAKGAGMDMVAINPSFVMGPPKSTRTDSTSVRFVKNLLDGSTTKVRGLGFGFVDVRDVAQAHVEAIERPNASGRYVLSSNKGFSGLQVAMALSKVDDFKGYPIPTEMDGPEPNLTNYSHAKAERDLGINFRDPMDAVVELARFLVKKGIVDKK